MPWSPDYHQVTQLYAGYLTLGTVPVRKEWNGYTSCKYLIESYEKYSFSVPLNPYDSRQRQSYIKEKIWKIENPTINQYCHYVQLYGISQCLLDSDLAGWRNLYGGTLRSQNKWYASLVAMPNSGAQVTLLTGKSHENGRLMKAMVHVSSSAKHILKLMVLTCQYRWLANTHLSSLSLLLFLCLCCLLSLRCIKVGRRWEGLMVD